MIGDNWERDVLGRCALGMRTVWISQGGRMPDAGPGPEVRAAVGPGDIGPL